MIPCFKPDFLERALRSLSLQSDKDFELILADDASPHDLASIVDLFSDRLNLRYVRFETNLGATNLCAHWNRAVQLASHEWIWFMGDDDELEPECIATMRQAISQQPDWTGLWRVNVRKINSNAEVIKECPPWPALLKPIDYLTARLAGEVESFACEYVFKKSLLEAHGGFVPFPLAWCSDDATWLSLAAGVGIRTVAGNQACARWRSSTQNISGAGSKLSKEKHESRLRYLEWLELRHAHLFPETSDAQWRSNSAQRLQWVNTALHSNKVRLNLTALVNTAWRLRCALKLPFFHVAYQLLRVQRWVVSYQ
ncbi:MAG: glycosyltransferase family 2 protein [Rhizobacter sp.]